MYALFREVSVYVFQRGIWLVEDVYDPGNLFIGKVPPLNLYQTVNHLLREAVFDNACRYTANNGKRRHIPGHDCACSNGSAIADVYAIHNDAVPADPDAIAYRYGVFLLAETSVCTPVGVPLPAPCLVEDGVRTEQVGRMSAWSHDCVARDEAEVSHSGVEQFGADANP